jgi:hypothetical protein
MATKGAVYGFQRWLMFGLGLLVVASLFGQFPLDSSVPVAADYDLTDEAEAEQFVDDLDAYATQVDLFAALSVVLQTGSIAFLAYAFAREAHEDTSHHVALRITMVLASIILVTSLVGRNFSLL